MNRLSFAAALAFSVAAIGCKPQPAAEAPAAQAPTRVTDLNELAAAVPNEGPREGNNYKVFVKILRQNQAPAEGFKVDAWVKNKGEKVTLVTDADGIAKFENLPFPDATHPLSAVFHYYNNGKDQSRDITYPYIESDAYRLKDTQYIPNTATAEPSVS